MPKQDMRQSMHDEHAHLRPLEHRDEIAPIHDARSIREHRMRDRLFEGPPHRDRKKRRREVRVVEQDVDARALHARPRDLLDLLR
jgi:hypothetical protein